MNIGEFAKEVLKTRMHTPSLSSLNELLSDGSEWILDFSAPWCPPCNNFLPHVRHASTILAQKNVKIAYIDCETYPGICNKYGIRSYPTLQFYGTDKAGKQVKETYSGDYDWQALVEFYEDIKNPSVRKLDAKIWREEIMHRPHEEIWFIDFAASWCRPCNRMFPEFKSAAKQLQGTVKFGHVECPENQELCESLGIRSYPTLKYLAPRKQGSPVSTPQTFPYQQRDEFAFIHFLSSELNRFSPIENASPQKNIFNYIQSVHSQEGKHVLIDFYANWCRPCKQFEPYYQLASIKYKETVLFAKVDCASSAHLCRGLNLAEYPTLMFFPNGGGQRSLIQTEFDIKDIQDQLDRVLARAPKLPPKPAKDEL